MNPDENLRRAASVNAAHYNAVRDSDALADNPHIRSRATRQFYYKLMADTFAFARQHTATPRVLDLGGGDGFAALLFLEFGARVTTVDISSNQLQKLQTSAGNRSPMLEVRCENVFEALSSIEGRSHRYDIVLASSFLHHVPDYLKLIRDAAAVTAAYGQFLSIEDPMRYDSMKRFDLAFSAFAYFSWRIFRHDPIGGFRRYLRRKRGDFSNPHEDDLEYHIVRGGVDQDSIRTLLRDLGFDCILYYLFSTHNPCLGRVGRAFGVKNTFATLARRRPGRTTISRSESFCLP